MNMEIDKEWKELILKAKEIGMTKEEIRNFLQQASKLTKHTK